MGRTRSAANQLDRVLSSSSMPIFVLDDGRTIVYCNQACCHWTGLSRDDLVGQRCDYHSAAEDDRARQVAHRLCPPPNAFGPKTVTAQIVLPGEDKGSRAEFVPLGRDLLESAGFLVLVLDHGVPSRDEDPLESDAAQLHHRLAVLRSRLIDRWLTGPLIGESAEVVRARQQIELVAGRSTHVVVTGPPGCGREQIARLCNYHDDAEAGPLVPVACPLMDAELLQGTVLSFAQQATESPYGALLLMEVDQLPNDAQGELAGLLALPDFDLRTIATAGESLLELADRGDFRHDLASSLSTLVIEIGPLKNRKQDIPLLVQFIVEQHNATGGKQLSGFADEAMDLLLAHDWPNNVEELEEIVTAACEGAEGPEIEVADLPEDVHLAAQARALPPRQIEAIKLDAFLEEIETELLRRALRQVGGNKTKAAELLGLNRARLHRRIQQLGLDGSAESE